MSKSESLRLFSFFLVLFSSFLIFNPALAEPIQGPYVPGEIIIKYSADATSGEISTLSSQLNSIRLREFTRIGASLEQLTDMTVPEAIGLLENNPLVEYIEPNYLYTIEVIPNDPDFPKLWGMHNTGQTGGTVDADIDAPEAWNEFTGSNNVIVAVIDSGVDYNHPDLAANAWTNPGEIPNNGLDDDGNGFIDDIHGWDFYNLDNDPMDDNSHGTHCSGTIGGVGNNALGVVGVNWNVKIMALKFLSAAGSGSSAGAISCIEYATMMGADLSSNSWGGGSFSIALEAAIQDAYTAGVLFVAAAGNSGGDNDIYPHYPSSYTIGNIVAVGATDHNDQRVNAGWASNYGITSVDIGAPGLDIYSTVPSGGYGYKSGTSMATPHVSGVLALVKGQFPGITVDAAKTLVFNSADVLPQLAGLWVTGGRLNAAMALSGPDSIPPDPVVDLAVNQTASNRISLVWTATGDDGDVGNASSYDIHFATFPIDSTNFDTATAVVNPPFPAPPGQPDSVTVEGLDFLTTYYFALKIRDEYGNPSPISNLATGTTLGIPIVSTSPSSLSSSLITGGRQDQILTISNVGDGTLDFTVETVKADSTALAMQAAAAAVVEGITPSGIAYLDEEPMAVLTPEEISLLRSRLISYDQAGAASSAGALPVIAVGGDYSADMMFHLLNNAPLTGLFSFQEVNYEYDDLTLVDGLIIAESDYAITGPKAIVLRDFFDTGRGIFIGMDDFDDIWSGTIPGLLGPVFGISNPVDNEFCSNPVLNTSHPINDSIPGFVIGGNWCNENDSFLLDGADWLFKGGNEGDIFGVANDSSARTVLMGENLAGVWAANEQLNANAVIWMMESGGIPTVNPVAGTIPAGGSMDITVTFDASELCGGDFFADVVVTSNDPVDPEVRVPTVMTVTGVPDIAVSATLLDYGSVFIGAVVTETLIVSNPGCDVINVTALTIDHPDFTTDLTPFDLLVGEERVLVVSYSPGGIGPVAGTLSLTSNDPDQPVVEVALTAEGLVAPIIGVSPTSLSADLLTGEMDTQLLTISNTGGNDLIFDISTEDMTAQGANSQVSSVQVSTGRLLNAAPAGTTAPAAAQNGATWDEGAVPSRDPLPAPVNTVPGTNATDLALLIVGNGDLAEIQAQLLAFSDISVVDIFDPSFGLPTLADLAAYHAVILANNSAFPDPNGLGDVLADYVDQGGGVVQTLASFVGGWNIGGRFMDDGYSAFNLGVGPVGSASLGAFDAGHPIMDGVTAVSGDLLATAPLATGAQWVADWDFGETFVATQGDQVAGVNIFVAGPGYWTGDLPLVLHNAAAWVSGATRWLDVDPNAGTVAPGASIDLLITFDATNVCGGTYLANILIDSNDPLSAQLVVPAEMIVTGEPDIAVSDTLLAYGPQFIGAAIPDTVIVSNPGCDLLQVTAIAIDHGDFSVDTTPFDLLVGEIRALEVFYSPTSVGPASGTLSLTSNDPDTPLLTVALTGEGFVAPVIGVNPTQLFADLVTGEMETQQLTIDNSGGNDLVWSIQSTKRDSLAALIQAAAASVVEGITPSGTLYGDEGTVATLSEDERSLLQGRLTAYEQTIAASGAAEVMPLIGVSGSYSFDMIYRLLGNPQLTGLYTFLEIYYETADLTDLDGLILAEGDGSINQAEATVIRDFYDSGRGIFIGMDDFDGIWYLPVSDLLAPVFGISSAADGDFCSNAVLNTNHPINEGIATFNISGDWCIDNDHFTLAGADWLFMDGVQGLYYGVANEGAANTVAMGENLAFIWSTNEQLNANAVIWMMEGASLPSVDPASGVIPPGGSQVVDVTFDAMDICGGNYYADLIITNNDPINSKLTVPADMHVTGETDIAVSDTLLAYGQVFMGAVVTDTVVVSNPGCDLLTVTGVSIDQADFTTDTTPFNLQVGESRALAVAYTPGGLGAVAGTLSLVSNDPDEPLVTVELTAEGVEAPIIGVSPTSLSADLLTGEIENQVLTISNTGGSDLIFDVSTQNQTAQGADSQVPSTRISSGRLLNAVPAGTEAPAAAQSGAAWSDGLTPLREPLPTPVNTIPGTNATDMALVIVGNGYLVEIQAQLLAFSDISVVDIFDVGFGNPTLANLAVYHAVILANGYSFPDPIGLGDVLADYVDQGGGVVQTIASFVDGWSIMGRFVDEGYSPFNLGAAFLGFAQLGSFDPAHPIMDGVTAVTSTGLASAPLAAGAQWVADWDFGEAFVATQGNQVAGVNIYVAETGYWTGDIPLVLHNAAAWVSGSAQWLSVDPSAGTLVPGASVDLLVTFDATGICSDTFLANILVDSNDPLASPFAVPVEMTVTGEPDIAVSDTLVAFGPVYMGATVADSVIVSNPGCDILTVRPYMAIRIQEAGFDIDTTHFELAAGESRALEVTFSPTGVGPVTGEFSLASNDPDESAIVVFLSGEGVTPPVIGVDPPVLDVTLLPEEIQVHQLTIENTGGADLVWEIFRSLRDSTALALQAAAAAVVTGITPSGSIVMDGVAVPGLSDEEKDLLRARLVEYRLTVSSFNGPEAVPEIGVGGSSSHNLLFMLLGNPQLAGMYTFSEVDYVYGDLTALDGLVVAESDGNIFEAGALALRAFYDSGRGIVMGMDDFIYIWDGPVGDLLEPVFGVTNPNDSNFCSNAELNTVHPINEGLTSFNLGGSWCNDNDDFQLVSAEWLFKDYSLGNIYGAAHSGTARTVVMGENLYGIWYPNEQLNVNAVVWMMEGSHLPSVDPSSGVIPAGSNQAVDVTFDATSICGGDFFYNLTVASNDPLTPEVVVPADMHVPGVPVIGLPDSLVTFGEVFIGFTATDTITITNSGCGVLDVTAISIDHGDFITDTTPFTVPVDGTHFLPVTYVPSTAGPALGILTLTNNDPGMPVAGITLTGTGMNTPVVDVVPGQLAADLQQGETETQLLTISNTGTGELIYAIGTVNAVGVGQSTVQVSTGRLLNPVKTGIKIDGDKTGKVTATAGQNSVGLADGMAPSREPYPVPTETIPVASGTDLQLLLLGSGELSEIQTQLLAYSDITVVDIFDGEHGTPTLVNLTAYNVVILANNFTFMDPVGTGDVLADYVDMGGGVIQTLGSFVRGFNIAGRFMDEGYAAFGLDTGLFGPTNLGDFNGLHPIMDGVTTAQCDLVSNITLASSAEWVADWDNGRTCVATNGNRVVGVNVFVAKTGYWSGDVDLILHNTVQWIGSHVTWLDIVPMDGVVPPGGSVDLMVTFDTAGSNPGDYGALIRVKTNDPVTPLVLVPVDLTIRGALMTVDVVATAGAASDLDNTLGIAEGATDGFDGQYDLPEPPPPPAGYVTGYFPHPEWGSPLGDRFMTDIRAPYDPGSDMKSWPFVVETDLGDSVTLAFTPSFTEAVGWQLWLRDEATGGMYNLFPSLTYTFTPGPGANAFTILVGRIVPPLQPVERQIAAGWSMLGAPLVPPTGGDTWADVLLDDTAGATFLFDYVGTSGYGDVGGGDPVIQGQGLWLASTDNFVWTMQGDPDEDTINVPAMIGWNLVGYPLWISGGLDGVSVEHDGHLYLWQDAVAAGLVSPFVYDYDGITDTYLPVISLEPWRGYWMAAHVSGVTLQFNYRSMLGVTHPAASASGETSDRLPLLVQAAPVREGKDDQPEAEKSGESGWQLNVGLSLGAGQVAIGRTAGATTGFDAAFDLPVPPASPSSTEKATLVIKHPEWNLACGSGFYSDMVALSDEPQEWNLTVTAPEPGSVNLVWDPMDLPAEVDLQVYLPHENRVVVMSVRDENSVQVDVGSTPVLVRFRTPNGISDVPGRLAGLQLRNAPNPFNPMTEFRFNLPHTGDAEIRIFDIRGAVVRRVTGGVIPAGPATLRWAGRDNSGREVASGIYFYRLYLDGRQEGKTLKMTLVK